ncbi:MAG: hypothetical protein ACLP7O_03680 [Terracidiphilus sp.]
MPTSETIRSMLAAGGNRLSIGRAEEIAALVLAQPKRVQSKTVTQLVECLWDEDPGVVNRAADALEKVSRTLPSVLDSWKASLLGLLAEATQNKLRWHLALIVPRLQLSLPECRRAVETLQSYLDDPSSIVKTCALQGLADLPRQDPSRGPEVLDLLRIHSRSGTPAMRARGHDLLRQLEAPCEKRRYRQSGRTQCKKNARRFGLPQKPSLL